MKKIKADKEVLQAKRKQGYFVVGSKRSINKIFDFDNPAEAPFFITKDRQEAKEFGNEKWKRWKFYTPLREAVWNDEDRVRLKNGLSCTVKKFYEMQEEGEISQEVFLSDNKMEGYYRMLKGQNKVVELK